jgi:putative ABC transport system permease protein
LRDTLVAAEIALALLLLTGAGLLIQTVQHLYKVNPGFDPSNVLTMSVWLPGAKYKEGEQRSQFFHQIVERIEQIPGVEAAGTTTVLPLSGGFDGRAVAVEGQPHIPSEQPGADMYVTTPDYLKAMKIPLVHGNYYTLQHTEKSQLVVLVNETMARTLWKGQDAIGKRIRLFTGPDQQTPWRTIIGVVKDVKNYGLDTIPPMQFYLPEAQFHSYYVSLVIRHKGIAPGPLVDQVRKSILSVDSQMPVFRIATMNTLLNNSIAVRRLSMALFGGFAFLALCLAVAGIYGVVSYVTAQRTTEIGIRMTLGAAKNDIVQLVLHQGMMPAILGALAGIAASVILTRFLKNLLFEIQPLDSTTYTVVSLAIILTAGIACYIPALRASKTDPLTSLRYE